MNNIIKEKIRGIKEEVNVLSLKKESLNDKVAMQEKFISEIESQGKGRIKKTKKKLLLFLQNLMVMCQQMNN